MSKVTSMLYSVNKIFSDTSQILSDIPKLGMTGRDNLELAESFHHSRFDDLGNFLDSSLLGRNAGAVQLFDINGRTTSKPYNAISESIKTHIPINGNDEVLSSFGHTERKLMREVLDEFITKKGHEEEIAIPSSRSRSSDPRDKSSEIPRALVLDAKEYQTYLTKQNTVVKMWSEIPACSYSPKGEGGKCSDFVNSIFPDNSQYGYIMTVPAGSKMKDIEALKKAPTSALNKFNNAYLQFKITLVKGISLLNLDSIVKRFNNEANQPDELSETFKAAMELPKVKDMYDFAAEDDLPALEAIFTSMKRDTINSKSKYGETLLGLAAQNNSLSVVEFLCENGANIDDKDKTGFTPLHWAASKGHKEVVEYLFTSGANANIKGSNNYTPFLQAVYNGYNVVVKFLHEKGASSKVEEGTFLKWASEFSSSSQTTPPRNHLEIGTYLQGEGLLDTQD